MNARQVLVQRSSRDRAATVAGTRPEVGNASGETHTRAEMCAPGGFVLRISGRRVATSDVGDLIDAAGPLSLRDIAGGLNVSMHQASTLVDWMLRHDWLRQDEWERHRLVQ